MHKISRRSPAIPISYVPSGTLTPRTRYWRQKNKMQKNKILLELEMTEKCLRGLFRQCRSYYRYKWCPQKISGMSLPIDTGAILKIKGRIRKEHFFTIKIKKGHLWFEETMAYLQCFDKTNFRRKKTSHRGQRPKVRRSFGIDYS